MTVRNQLASSKARKIAADIRTKFAAGGNPISDMKAAKRLVSRCGYVNQPNPG